MKIASSTSAMPELLDQLHDWFQLEWGEINGFQRDQTVREVPAPLLALNDGDELMGGLAFTTYPRPDGRAPGVWINALFVAPDFRGQGIASKLVRAAELESGGQDIPALFVYTDIPHLYQNLGWLVVEEHGENVVLTKPVARRLG